jgi:ABC-type antimicrobial peptide transport system permease subunit
MKFLDIVRMSAGNLWRRKLRTFLTVLGVMIGTASIVVMMSLGIGLKTAMMEQMTAYGGMTEIEVYRNYGNDDVQLNDSAIESFKNIAGVESVSPILSMSGTFTQGKYSAYANIQGVTQEYLAKIPVGEGRRPSADSGQVEILMGNTVITDFYVTATYSYPYYEKGELAAVDLMNKTLFTQFSSTGSYSSDGTYIEQPAKKNIFPVVGIVEGDVEDWNQYGYSAYVDIDALKAYLKKTYKGNTVIPGQPTDKNGKPLKEIVYSQIYVSAASADDVDSILSTIQDMGFSAYSQAEWLKQTEQELLIIQAVLGGIGAVAFLVAAIGIANTMMMSTYERTKEIGVMKVLGCSLPNIRTLFLTEAAFIGVIGGFAGLGISYALSYVCNLVLPAAMGYNDSRLSIIPLWLAGTAIIFAALVGMLAGFFPAQRATKLSPLAAIRNE